MSLDYLEFEKPIAELEEKILELQRVSDDRSMNFDGEIETMREKNKR